MMKLVGKHCRSMVVLCMLTGAVCSAKNITLSSIIEDMFVKYDKTLSPKHDKPSGERQVEVTVDIYIISMYSISEIDMDYSLSMFLRQRWVDERLQFDDVLNFTRIELATSMFDKIWTPDMYIPTEKYSDFHEVTVRNQMVHIYPDGTLQYSARVTGSFVCTMNLRKYPFDTQYCKLELESYAFATDRLKFTWSDGPLIMSKGIEFPQFNLKESSTYNCKKDYYGISYPCIGVQFILRRDYSYYVVQIYIPSVLIVILSWVNFWLDCTSVPGRVSLALLTVLSMTTQSSGARTNLPRVSYIKAIDIWMAACLTFVFLGLVEFAYVNVQSRVYSREINRRRSLYHVQRKGNGHIPNGGSGTLQNGDTRRIQNGDAGSIQNSDIDTNTEEHLKPNRKKCKIDVEELPSEECTSASWLPCFKQLAGIERARAIDKISRLLFPLSFGLFNACYWSYYFLVSDDTRDINDVT